MISTCIDTDWQPPTYTVWEGDLFTQTSNCGNTRTAIGSKAKPIVEDMTLTTLYNGQTQSLELSWTDISDTGQYKLNKAWFDSSNQLVENEEIFTNNEHSYIDTDMIPLSIYYYSVKAFMDGYWNHKSQIIVFNLSLEKIEYWIAVENYEEQQTGLFNGYSWKKP